MQKNLMIGISVVAACVILCASNSSASNGQKIEKMSSPMGRGNTLYVGGDGPGNYSRIQDAINASSDGDTVFVFRGSYYGKVFINKSISLLGENASRTFINDTYEPDWASQVVRISFHNVELSGFTVVIEQGDGVGIRLSNSRNCTISHNSVKASCGLYLRNSSNSIIQNNSWFTIAFGIFNYEPDTGSSYNIIRYNWFTNAGESVHLDDCGIYFQVLAKENVISDNYFYHCYGYAVLSYSPYRNIIERNIIRGNNSRGISIYIEYSDYFPPGNIIKENDIASCTLGIGLTGDYFTVENNVIHDDDWGMQITPFSCYHVTVSNNTFLNDTSVGLVFENGKQGSVVERNVFHNCGAALDLYQCNGLTVQHNNITVNIRAIYSAESKADVISQNNLIGNNRNVLSLFSRDIWRGNYWDEPLNHPKLILGILPFIQFDWHPAQQPN